MSLVENASTASACAVRALLDLIARFVLALETATARGRVWTANASAHLSSRAPIAASLRASIAAPTMVFAWMEPAGVSLDLVALIAAQKHAQEIADLVRTATMVCACASQELFVTWTRLNASQSTAPSTVFTHASASVPTRTLHKESGPLEGATFSVHVNACPCVLDPK